MRDATIIVGGYTAFLIIQLLLDRISGWQLFECFTNQED
jgi:hypothetical protein